MKSTFVLAALATSALAVNLVQGHGYMVEPQGRTTDTFGDPEDKGACDSDKPGHVSSYAAGAEVEVVWTRNNHLGGFIRYSLAPRDAATKDNFDKNAFFYTCREANCSLKKCSSKFCGDDPGSKDHEIKCRAKIKLPDYLPAGDYVLQWVWHAAGSSYGKVGWSTGNFKTCADIRLTTSGNGKKPTCPTFVGGDRASFMEKDFNDQQKTSQCMYFDDNGLSKQIVKYDEEEGYKKYVFGVPKAVQSCSTGGDGGIGGGDKGGNDGEGPKQHASPGKDANVTSVTFADLN